MVAVTSRPAAAVSEDASARRALDRFGESADAASWKPSQRPRMLMMSLGDSEARLIG